MPMQATALSLLTSRHSGLLNRFNIESMFGISNNLLYRDIHDKFRPTLAGAPYHPAQTAR